MDGTVKWYNKQKGYGFVVGDDGQEYFVHYSYLPKNIVLIENQKVAFDPASNDRGKQAHNLVVKENAE
jgi:CspA family cold shock protein